MSHNGKGTGVLFGLMRDLALWADVFETNRFVFCFDSRHNKRKQIYQRYKENRRLELTDEEKAEKQLFYDEVERLREEDLFRLGFRNVFWTEGYEGDDVIASVCLFSLGENDRAIVVSRDSDLWQLITNRVSVYDPFGGKRRTVQWFAKQYGISPSQWADVKAIAGCNTDNVRGIEGVGEKSAVEFLAGTLDQKFKRYKAIIDGNDRWRRNLELVKLPFEGCPRYELNDDRLSRQRWKDVSRRWGLRSLREFFPGR